MIEFLDSSYDRYYDFYYDEVDVCSDCSGSLNDGEGYDGLCGDCADREFKCHIE